MTRASEASDDAYSGRFVDALGYAAEVHAGQIGGGRAAVHRPSAPGRGVGDPGGRLRGRGDRGAAPRRRRGSGGPCPARGHPQPLRQSGRRHGRRSAPTRSPTQAALASPQGASHLAEMDRCSPSAVLVLLADKLDNARTMLRQHRVHGEGQWGRSGKQPGDVRWYYRALAERLAPLRPGPLADELVRACAELISRDRRRAGATSA